MRGKTMDTTTPDAELFEMTRRHDRIYAEWQTRSEVNEDDPEIDSLSDASTELAHRILLWQVETPVGLAEKRRVVEIAGLEVESNHWGDFAEFIYELDAERIAATA
jgi:hypothetical protein